MFLNLTSFHFLSLAVYSKKTEIIKQKIEIFYFRKGNTDTQKKERKQIRMKKYFSNISTHLALLSGHCRLWSFATCLLWAITVAMSQVAPGRESDLTTSAPAPARVMQHLGRCRYIARTVLTTPPTLTTTTTCIECGCERVFIYIDDFQVSFKQLTLKTNKQKKRMVEIRCIPRFKFNTRVERERERSIYW